MYCDIARLCGGADGESNGFIWREFFITGLPTKPYTAATCVCRKLLCRYDTQIAWRAFLPWVKAIPVTDREGL
jgi:hypothetical protein